MIDYSEKHAYLVMAHNNLDQLNILLKLLDDNRNDIYLHIDARSPISESEVIQLRYSPLYFVQRIKVYWADYSQVECELLLLEAAAKKGYSYYHLLSGSDLPIKSQDYIHKFFEKTDLIYLHYTTKERTDQAISYVKYYHLFQKQLCEVNRGKQFSLWKVINKACLLAQQIFGVNRINDNYQMKKGANWFSIPYDFANYVIDNKELIERKFNSARSPDEFFLQTLAYNSIFQKRIYRLKEDDSYKSCLRLIDWTRGLPYVYRITDFEELLQSDMLFARKFDINIDKTIIMSICSMLNDEMTETRDEIF